MRNFSATSSPLPTAPTSFLAILAIACWVSPAPASTPVAPSACSSGAGAVTCGDGVCVPLLEDDFTCPLDCGSPDACEPDECGEPATTLAILQGVGSGGDCWCDEFCVFGGDCCPNACDVCGSCGAICGDGVCRGGETASSCPEDCPVCGDGICLPEIEDGLDYCPEDCG